MDHALHKTPPFGLERSPAIMPELIFQSGADVLFRAPLTGRAFRVGQNPLNDLMLVDPWVAPFQASVEHGPGGHMLWDRSGMGTLINGCKVTHAALNHGDRVGLGRFTAVFESGQRNPGVTGRMAGHEDMVPPSGLCLCAGDGRRWAVPSVGLRIGKDLTNDIILDDTCVSAFHALVFCRGGAAVVKDLGSTNGTYINAVRIGEGEAPAGTTLTLGRVSLAVLDDTPPAHRRLRTRVRSVGNLLYVDPVMEPVAAAVRRVAPHEAPVCITGESGCGKELVAQAVHALGPRAALPFVAVNCAAISPQLVESELFGHEKGAFTGADRTRSGAFEEAGAGTLFLDEVGDLPLDVQAKLLRALENQEIKRVGADRARKIHCRIITATHMNLVARIAEGLFRNDLFHRLAALPIRVPPLRERPGDIAILTQHFLALVGTGQVTVSEEAAAKMRAHRWPGNVRELKNVLLQARVFSGKEQLDEESIQFTPIGLEDHVAQARVYSPGKTLADIETEAMLQAVAMHGNHAEAARQLGIARSTLVNRLMHRR